MYTHLTSQDSSETLTISNFLDNNEEVLQPRRYKAVRNGKENFVLQLFPVRNVQDLTSSSLCLGTPEADILALLARSRVPVTELVTMFLIEASGGDIVYRSRACVQLIPSLLRTGKCDSCLGLLENIKHLEPEEKKEEGIVEAELTSQNLDNVCAFDDIPEQDEIREKIEVPQIIKFKSKLGDNARRKPTKKVIKSLEACPSNEPLDPHDSYELKSDLVSESMKIEFDDNDIFDPVEEEYLAIEQASAIQKNENINGSSEMPHLKRGRGRPKKAGSKLKRHKSETIKVGLDDILDPAEEDKAENEHIDRRGRGRPKKAELQKVMSKCIFCAEIFRAGSVKLLRHMKLFHESESETEAYKNFFLENVPLICPQCGREYINETFLQNHKRMCKGKKVTSCHICGKSYKAGQSLENHLRRHQKDENEVCPHCGKLYDNKQRLQDHMFSCSEKGSFKCPSCEKVFISNFNLELHVRRVHKKEKECACEHCGKSFFRVRELNEHIISIHEKIKPFICEQCGFKTAKIDNLNLHRKKRHEKSYLGLRAFWDMIQSGNHPYIDQNYEYLHLLKPKQKELINKI